MVQAAREAARRSQCTNNLKQLGLAVHNYNAANGCLVLQSVWPSGNYPSGLTTGFQTGGASYSWTVALLPFYEQQTLANAFNYSNYVWTNSVTAACYQRKPTTVGYTYCECPALSLRQYRIRTGIPLRDEELLQQPWWPWNHRGLDRDHRSAVLLVQPSHPRPHRLLKRPGRLVQHRVVQRAA